MKETRGGRLSVLCAGKGLTHTKGNLVECIPMEKGTRVGDRWVTGAPKGEGTGVKIRERVSTWSG
jgi:hypothetical protein